MTRLSLLLAALSALLLARRSPSHRPIAAGLALLLAIDVARLATAGREGWAWRVDAALCSGWYVVTLAIVWHGLAGVWRSPARWLAPWTYATLPVWITKARGGDMAETWRGVFVVCLVAQLCGVVVWYAFARRRPWSPAEVVALLLVASSIADLAGPWLRAEGMVASWKLARVQSVALWGTIALYQTWCLWTAKGERRWATR